MCSTSPDESSKQIGSEKTAAPASSGARSSIVRSSAVLAARPAASSRSRSASIRSSRSPSLCGGPAGGAELREALGGAGALRQRPLDSVAVDAVWVALSGGSSYVAPEELDRQLARWRPAPAQVRLGQFERALLQGRATIVGGYLELFGLQALVLAVLVVGPLLERAS